MKIPTVVATLYRNRQIAGFQSLIVSVCPYCRKRHIHSGPDGEAPPTGIRRAPCGNGRTYRVEWRGATAQQYPGGGRTANNMK